MSMLLDLDNSVYSLLALYSIAKGSILGYILFQRVDTKMKIAV
jgi:hypothetical protein